jgi:hypothetical protein
MAKEKVELKLREKYLKEFKSCSKKIVKLQKNMLDDMIENEEITKFFNDTMNDLNKAILNLSQVIEKFSYKDDANEFGEN